LVGVVPDASWTAFIARQAVVGLRPTRFRQLAHQARLAVA
jgi:hypothetical protein